MIQLPRRTDYTRWENPEPFTDMYAVLGLLNRESPTYEPNHLDFSREIGIDWEIVTPWYSQGSSGGDTSGHYYFQIDPVLVAELRENGFVKKRTIPRMGYTETCETELVISQAGKEHLKRFEREMREKAEGMLVPGIHTDLTGAIQYRGFERDHWRYGPLYFLFEMPEERGCCKVYPEEGRIVLPTE